ncbi:MAG: hypothetical protein HQ511_10595 [Rhodospirillales bacterium]|nr:hypothetical protein [Rhodospirillales bacterium]
MPTLKHFEAALYPAARSGAFVTVELCIGQPEKVPRLKIEAATLGGLVDQVKTFAEAHGQPCAAWLRCTDKRAPAGFKALPDLYYNLDNPKPQAAAA